MKRDPKEKMKENVWQSIVNDPNLDESSDSDEFEVEIN